MFFKRILYTALYLIGALSALPTIAEDRALIVGINNYISIRHLDGCRKDVENMQHLIQEVWGYKPQQIRVLVDGDATRQGILAAFDEWLIRGTQPGDRVVFHFSGHGSQMQNLDGTEEDGQDETLCPVDTKNNVTPQESNMIRDKEINVLLRKLKGRQVIFISDSCHSGTITRDFGKSTENIDSKIKLFRFSGNTSPKGPTSRAIGLPEPTHNFVEKLDNVIVYSAVSPSQVALDTGPQGGVFTQAFIKGIQHKAADRNGDGIVTHAEALEYLRNESQTYCDRTGKCETNKGRLTPELEADEKWLSVDIRARSSDGAPPPPSDSVEATMDVAQILDSNNSAQLQTQMLPNTHFRLGDKMQVNVSSKHNGYLFVIDINSQGKLTLLFPNTYSDKQNFKGILQAGQTVMIPDNSYGFEFVAEEPTGEGLLLTLLVEEDENFVRDLRQQLPSPQRGFGVVNKANQVQVTLQQLHQKLHQTIMTAEGIGRPIKWSMVETNYAIQ